VLEHSGHSLGVARPLAPLLLVQFLRDLSKLTILGNPAKAFRFAGFHDVDRHSNRDASGESLARIEG
jgi:hypothetical protein